MTSKIWVYIDQFRGVASPASWEAIGVAKSLSGGADVTALVFGEGVGSIVKQAFEYGADSVWVCDHATLADYRVEPYAGLLAKLAENEKPELVLAPTSTRVRDVFSSAAVDLGAGVVVDATDIELKDGQAHVTRPVYAGKLLSTVVLKNGRTQLVTLRPRAFPAPSRYPGAPGMWCRLTLSWKKRPSQPRYPSTSWKKARCEWTELPSSYRVGAAWAGRKASSPCASWPLL
jgi:electron transfer flavoprotein alpha subunit